MKTDVNPVPVSRAGGPQFESGRYSIFQSNHAPEMGLGRLGPKKGGRADEELLSETIAVFERGGGLRGSWKLCTLLPRPKDLLSFPFPLPSCRVPDRPVRPSATRFPAATQRRERQASSSFLLRCCRRKAHSVSLIRGACWCRKAAVMPGFKWLSTSSSKSNFSQGVR